GFTSDNRSRAFDLAGRNLWIDGNRFNNTGSFPGNDGEGILGRAAGGTPVYSWAITRNVHTRGAGPPGSMGGTDVDCRGLLIGWNEPAGGAGTAVSKRGLTMADCAFVANKCKNVVPEATTATKFGLQPPLTANPPGIPNAPTKVTAEVYNEDAV